MSLMSVFDSSDGSRILADVAAAAGTDAQTVKRGLDLLCPAIAAALQEKVADDPDLADDLADLLDDNLNPSVAGEDAAVDGKAMLKALFGSQKAAKDVLSRAAPDLPEAVLTRLAPVAAVTVIAAVAEQTRPSGISGMLTVSGATGSGIVGTLLTAIISSAIKGVIRELTSARTSRTASRTRRPARTAQSRSTRSRTTRRTKSRKTAATRSRRNPEISIEDILGGLFGTKGKQE